MASKIQPATVIVSDEVKSIIDIFAKADAAEKAAKATKDTNRDAIIQAAIPTYNANMSKGVKSVNMSGNDAIAQVSFKESYSINEHAPLFANVKANVDAGILPCVTKTEGQVCVRADKAAEIVAFLTSLGRADLLIQSEPAYALNRDVFDAMEKTPVYTGRAELIACLNVNSINSVKIL